MKNNYKGFNEYFDESLIELKEALNKHYEAMAGKKFDVRDNKFIKEIKGEEFTVHSEDKEKAAALGLLVIDKIYSKKDMLSKFKNYQLAFFLYTLIESQKDIEKFFKRIKQNAANQKWAKSPKTQAKVSVKEYWIKWKKNKSLYKSKSAFANDMLNKFEGILESTKVIEGWCRKWEEESVS